MARRGRATGAIAALIASSCVLTGTVGMAFASTARPGATGSGKIAVHAYNKHHHAYAGVRVCRYKANADHGAHTCVTTNAKGLATFSHVAVGYYDVKSTKGGKVLDWTDGVHVRAGRTAHVVIGTPPSSCAGLCPPVGQA